MIPSKFPFTVSMAGHVYTFAGAPTMTIVELAASGAWCDLGLMLLDPADRESVNARMMDPHDDLDAHHVSELAIRSIPVMSGMGDGIQGWRVTMSLCGHLVSSWPDASGRLLEMGIDPMDDPFWRVMSGLRHIIVSNVPSEDRNWIRDILESPLPLEPPFFEGAGDIGRDMADRNRQAFDSMLE